MESLNKLLTNKGWYYAGSCNCGGVPQRIYKRKGEEYPKIHIAQSQNWFKYKEGPFKTFKKTLNEISQHL